MAEDDQDLELDVEEEEEGKGGKGKLIIIAAVVVLLIGGVAAFFLLSGDSDSSQDEAAEEQVEPKEPAQYVGVPEAITSNIKGDRRNRTVQIKMSFMVRGDEAVDIVKSHMPQLKNDVLMLVSQQTVEELKTPEGRKMLQDKSLETVQKSLTDLVGEPVIERVLFISFLMQ
ncbi:flagellar basal body-associated protein FliL [Aliikangiella marina]|uniref:Flagellar protein FliL n=1 Tax=Aliikangiella marina TaxID=1712262 RepID=A0A545TDR6_9GAMM|nr:flagellar basal body-associated FliL family protein [Aliikangiella marina]TQV75350.1 flagellar basal body-associated protein FliL [Aliikangiella marina]